MIKHYFIIFALALSCFTLICYFSKDKSEPIDRTNVICYDTIKVASIKHDTIRASSIDQKVYRRLNNGQVLEEEACTFDFEYQRDKINKWIFDSIGYTIPYDTLIEWRSKNNDTLFFIHLRK